MPSFKSWPASLSALAAWLPLRSSVTARLAFGLIRDYLARSLTPCGRGRVHPAAPSRRSHAALAAARDIENVKAAKYRAVASERGANFLGFIAESYGALGNHAVEVLRLLNNTLNQAPGRPFELSERAVAETLSVALQRGNAFISHAGNLTA